MRITFLGAAGEVTGSAYLVETADARVLVDFGMFQGARDDYKRNVVAPAIRPAELDAVVVTHAHNDHVGRLPLLPGAGFRGPIWATPASVELASLMLRDAGNIQEMDTERINRVRARRGMDPITPLYTLADVERTIPLLRPAAMGAETPVAPGVSVRFAEAGHILGSTSVVLTARDGGATKTVVFSGDLGPRGSPILRDPVPPTSASVPRADLVIMESTYGDRDHKPLGPTIDEFCEVIKAAVWAKEKVIIPAFAVGRTQSLIYHLGELVRGGRVPRFPVFVDSPLAIDVVNLYRKHRDLHDQESRELRRNGHDPLDLPGLTFCKTGEESRRLNTLEGAAVIMAGSGMATGGRILHHLKHNLWRRDAQVLIVGFQAKGSLGRQLVERAERVRIMGQEVAVRAKIHTLGGLSAHAGRSELLEWAGAFAPREPGAAWPRFVLTHGEDAPRAALAAGLREKLGVGAELPTFGTSITL
jgi:metallo-beta-lactamase family protein